ncbi:uncharacterized protein LOC103101856 [Monodelphis domestica]|uniref:uncharacterized protein LOC103101856 n=1 Tax=Monodelphis domestica TaxID=13616 RepID=UPI0024E25B16|nr:uncharacterized protein LOC103101856 [Monodelphis domestica]
MVSPGIRGFPVAGRARAPRILTFLEAGALPSAGGHGDGPGHVRGGDARGARRFSRRHHPAQVQPLWAAAAILGRRLRANGGTTMPRSRFRTRCCCYYCCCCCRGGASRPPASSSCPGARRGAGSRGLRAARAPAATAVGGHARRRVRARTRTRRRRQREWELREVRPSAACAEAAARPVRSYSNYHWREDPALSLQLLLPLLLLLLLFRFALPGLA